MHVFAPALFLSFLALISSAAGGVVRGPSTARDIVDADNGNLVRRAIETAPSTTAVPGALLYGKVHQELGNR
ncbi:hypothetical protein EV363DRAFT_1322127 [Boletus edulis]|nr:hypothetical protein EV363DRAFT_1322127 [Boletus edulis]